MMVGWFPRFEPLGHLVDVHVQDSLGPCRGPHSGHSSLLLQFPQGCGPHIGVDGIQVPTGLQPEAEVSVADEQDLLPVRGNHECGGSDVAGLEAPPGKAVLRIFQDSQGSGHTGLFLEVGGTV